MAMAAASDDKLDSMDSISSSLKAVPPSPGCRTAASSTSIASQRTWLEQQINEPSAVSTTGMGAKAALIRPNEVIKPAKGGVLKRIKALPKPAKQLLALQLVVAALHCASAGIFLGVGPGTYFYSHTRVLAVATLFAGGGGGLLLLLLGLFLEESYVLRAYMTASVTTSFISLFVVAHAAGTIITALVFQLICLHIYRGPFWKHFVWREMKRYVPADRTHYKMRMAAMRARAALRADFVRGVLYLIAIHTLRDSYVSTSVKLMGTSVQTPLLVLRGPLRDQVVAMTGAGAIALQVVVHLVELFAVDGRVLPAVIRPTRPAIRHVARLTAVVFASIAAWFSLMLVIGWCLYMAFVGNYRETIVAEDLMEPADNLANTAVLFILLALLIGRACCSAPHLLSPRHSHLAHTRSHLAPPALTSRRPGHRLHSASPALRCPQGQARGPLALLGRCSPRLQGRPFSPHRGKARDGHQRSRCFRRRAGRRQQWAPVRARQQLAWPRQEALAQEEDQPGERGGDITRPRIRRPRSSEPRSV